MPSSVCTAGPERPDRMPEEMPDRMSDRMPQKKPDKMPWDMPDRVPEDMPDRMLEDMPDRMPDRMPAGMPDKVPEGMPDKVPECLPDRSQKICQIGCQKICQKICQKRCQVECQKICQVVMPDRMPEDMSDRMPEDLPVTKRIYVMVGITRSKVIFATTFSKPLDADSYQDVLAKGSTHRESQMIVAGFVSNSPSCIWWIVRMVARLNIDLCCWSPDFLNPIRTRTIHIYTYIRVICMLYICILYV